jgi:hypothetical protein
MPRYSNYGSLDNVMVDEGDVAFNRVNARLRPDQLKEGDDSVLVQWAHGSWWGMATAQGHHQL